MKQDQDVEISRAAPPQPPGPASDDEQPRTEAIEEPRIEAMDIQVPDATPSRSSFRVTAIMMALYVSQPRISRLSNLN